MFKSIRPVLGSHKGITYQDSLYITATLRLTITCSVIQFQNYLLMFCKKKKKKLVYFNFLLESSDSVIFIRHLYIVMIKNYT